MKNTGKRWSGLDWASEQRDIFIVGAGGIGSWTCLSLSRIMHTIIIADGDVIDVTNVEGGQLYRTSDVGEAKVNAISEICREFGCTNIIDVMPQMFDKNMGMSDVCITALDNMASRKEVFKAWEEHINSVISDGGSLDECIFIDGRMNAELFEIFAIQGNNEEQIREYKERHLFSDKESPDLDCTTKSTTFMAMGIASNITGIICNWITNQVLGMSVRVVPFYQRVHIPSFTFVTKEAEMLEIA